MGAVRAWRGWRRLRPDDERPGPTLGDGKRVDSAAFAAWSASEEGRRFITLSSEAWRDASIEAGTDRKPAQAAATSTTLFFTGTETKPPAAGGGAP